MTYSPNVAVAPRIRPTVTGVSWFLDANGVARLRCPVGCGHNPNLTDGLRVRRHRRLISGTWRSVVCESSGADVIDPVYEGRMVPAWRDYGYGPVRGYVIRREP